MILLFYTYACVYMCMYIYLSAFTVPGILSFGFGPALFQYDLIFTNCICKTRFPNEVTFWGPGHRDLDILTWGEDAPSHPCRQECRILSTKSVLHFLGHLHCVQTSKWHENEMKWNENETRNKPRNQQTNQLVPERDSHVYSVWRRLSVFFCIGQKPASCLCNQSHLCNNLHTKLFKTAATSFPGSAVICPMHSDLYQREEALLIFTLNDVPLI